MHEHGSNNPLGIKNIDAIPFHPYYTFKDIQGALVALFIYLIFVFYLPNYAGHSDNYIPANPEVTPSHIVPEWYFLPFYGILRSIPSKLGGVLLLAGALLLLFIFPLISKPIIRSGSFRPVYQHIFWFFIAVCFLLGWSWWSNRSDTILRNLSTRYFFLFFFFFVFKPYLCLV